MTWLVNGQPNISVIGSFSSDLDKTDILHWVCQQVIYQFFMLDTQGSEIEGFSLVECFLFISCHITDLTY